MINYVVGFFHNEINVVLIEKQCPEWQKGLLNGVGGHIEEGEMPLGAMCREFQEETGLDVRNWNLDVIMTSPDWRVRFYSAHGMFGVLDQ